MSALAQGEDGAEYTLYTKSTPRPQRWVGGAGVCVGTRQEEADGKTERVVGGFWQFLFFPFKSNSFASQILKGQFLVSG